MTIPRHLAAAAAVQRKAYAPYSHYQVGAAVLTADDCVFSGCNVENASYGVTICAERVALGAAVAAGHRAFKALAIVAGGEATPFPCGACRQVLAEFCGPQFPVTIACVAALGDAITITLGELLPHRFTLEPESGARPGSEGS